MCCNFNGTHTQCKRAACSLKYVLYETAVEACSEMGMRLCHPSEFKKNICCNSGCAVENNAVWQNTTESMCIQNMLRTIV